MSNIKHSAFEDHNMNDKDDEDDELLSTKNEKTCPKCGSPECDGSCSKSNLTENDFDIRAFF